jgi:transposase InsO family protein
MAFQQKTVMQQKLDFVILAGKINANISLLSRRFGITRKTAYKWIKRYKQQGEAGLADQSKKPKTSPFKTCPTIEVPILNLRKENPEWGAKKLKKVLERERILPPRQIPSKPTITNILKRNGLISKDKSEKAEHWQRFERELPNELWQMDFKGHFNLLDNTVCYPLTILDDHSRYNLGLFASKDQRWFTVKDYLTQVFTNYGLPMTILADNGSPWGSAGNVTEEGLRAFTKLEKWLILLGINISHGRPYHPQTQGKEERFHRTLKAELLQHEQLKDFVHCQHKFDKWREKYNHYRPHESIALKVPSQLYQPSKRTLPSIIKSPEYDLSDLVRKVFEGGVITFNKKQFKVGRAFIGDTVAIRATQEEGIYEVYFCNQRIRTLNLRT